MKWLIREFEKDINFLKFINQFVSSGPFAGAFFDRKGAVVANLDNVQSVGIAREQLFANHDCLA
jgi:hypothetical protein